MDSGLEELTPEAFASACGKSNASARATNRRLPPNPRKKFGRLCSEQKGTSASLTKTCRFPRVNDLTSDRVVAYAGDFILVNCTKSKLPVSFLVESTFECFDGGEFMGALVQD